MPAYTESARVLSPELALVDSELAAWARLRLQEDAVAAEVAAAAAPAVEPAPAVLEPERRPRSLLPLAVATAAAAAIIAAVAVALRPSRDDSAKRAAATPTTVTPTAPAATTPTTATLTTPAKTNPTKPAATATHTTRTTTTPTTATHTTPAATPTTAARTPPAASIPFAWPGVTGARAYVFTLSRGTKVIYRAKTSAEQLALKRSWKYQGQRYRLTRGAYRWHVIALVRSEPHGTRTVISAPFWLDRDR